MLRTFFGGKDGATTQTLPAPPHLIQPSLRAGIHHACFAATMYTNHVNILSYG